MTITERFYNQYLFPIDEIPFSEITEAEKNELKNHVKKIKFIPNWYKEGRPNEEQQIKDYRRSLYNQAVKEGLIILKNK